MRFPLQTILLVLVIFPLCACDRPQDLTEPATPTPAILADSFFFGCAYVDSNGDGEIDANDDRLKDATFVVTLSQGAGFGASTSGNGCATIVVPGGLNEDSWPVITRTKPPPETSYELISPAEVVLEYPETHADFLFTDSQ